DNRRHARSRSTGCRTAMIAVDTNVLVRFLVEDDPQQTKRADALFRRVAAKGERLFVSDIVLCELVWVLEIASGVQRGEIAETIANLSRAREVDFGHSDLIQRALHAFRAGRGDFADYVIRERALAAGASAIATFDKRLWSERPFEKL